MMYGFGDAKDPPAESVSYLETIGEPRSERAKTLSCLQLAEARFCGKPAGPVRTQLFPRGKTRATLRSDPEIR